MIESCMAYMATNSIAVNPKKVTSWFKSCMGQICQMHAALQIIYPIS